MFNPAIQAIQDKVDLIESQMIQSNHLIHQANCYLKFFGIFSLVLLTLFLIVGLLCLGISLKLPYLVELTEKLEEFLGATGMETGVEPVTQPDLSVGLAVAPETTTLSTPEGLDAGSEEDSSFLIFDFTPFGGAKV